LQGWLVRPGCNEASNEGENHRSMSYKNAHEAALELASARIE
jgi:hypothetical protein